MNHQLNMQTWDEFKAVVKAWGIRPLVRHTPKAQGVYKRVWVEFEGQVFQVAYDMIEGDPETLDFETNIMNNPSTQWGTGRDTMRNDDAYEFAATEAGATIHEHLFQADTYLFGGALIVAGVTALECQGDYVSMLIVDKDYLYAGVLYPATPAEAGIPGTEGLTWAQVMPNGVVLREHVKKKYIDVSGTAGRLYIESKSGPALVPAGVYMRTTFMAQAQSPTRKVLVSLEQEVKASAVK